MGGCLRVRKHPKFNTNKDNRAVFDSSARKDRSQHNSDWWESWHATKDLRAESARWQMLKMPGLLDVIEAVSVFKYAGSVSPKYPGKQELSLVGCGCK